MFDSILVSVRETAADWFRGMEPKDDPALKGKKDTADGFKIQVPRRNVGPSSTQVRSVINNIVNHINLILISGFSKAA